MFSPALICLFACQLSALYKNYSTTFLTTSVERWQTDHGKKPLDYGGNLDGIILGVGFQ